MIIAIQNTIGAIGRGLGIVTRNLQMWLGFTKADVVGAELVENGDFATDISNWTAKDGTQVYSNNSLVFTTTSNNSGGPFQNIGLVNGSTYQLIMTMKLITSSSNGVLGLILSNGGGGGQNVVYQGSVLVSGGPAITEVITFTAGSGEVSIQPFADELNATYSVSNISVKEVAQFIPDKSTNSNNAKLFTGKALEFNGNDSVDLGTTFQGIKTIAFWCKTDTTANRTVLGLSSANSPYIQIVPSNNKVYVEPPIGVRLEFSFESLSTLIWHRVVISVNSSNLVECYVNGNKSTDSFTNTEDLFSFNQIGRRGSSLDHWIGNLSDLQIYNSAWASDDVTYDYANPNKLVFNNAASSISVSNLKGYYALSEGSGSIAYDSSGEGNSGNVYDGSILGATYVLKQPTIPQLGMMDWSKGSNLFVNSQVFTAWIRGNTSLTSNNTTSPLGDQTGSTLTTTNNGSTFYISSNVVASTSYTFSFYVKRGNMSGLKYRIYDNSNTNNIVAPTSYYSETSASAWVRVSKTFTTPSGCTSIRTYIISDSASTGTVRIWGSQLEQSSTLGSYIGTSGLAASNATLIQNPNDLGKDVLGNSLRLRDGGFNLDGSGYAEVADDASLDFGTGDFSIECWAKFAFLNKTSAWNSIVCLGGGVYRNNSAGLATRVGEFALNVGNSELISTPTLIVGNWYHIVGTRTGSTTRLYIDSVVESLTGTSSQDVTNTLVKMIGDDDDTTTNHDRHYEDLIDDVRLYKNKALSQKEIDNNYKVGLSKHKN